MLSLDAAYIISTLFGLLHGLNPASGWLLGVYPALINRKWIYIPRAMLMIVIGHAISSATIIATLASIISAVRIQIFLISAVSGALIMLIGFYRASRPGGHRHRYSGLSIGSLGLIMWGLVSGLQQGSLLMVAPAIFVCSGSYYSYYLSESLIKNLLGVIASHHIAMFISMLTLGIITYLLGVRLLKRLWIGHEIVSNIALILLGTLLMIYSFLGIINANPAF